MPIVALTLHGTNVASTTLSTANKMVIAVGGAAVLNNTTGPGDNSTKWMELLSQGGTGTVNAAIPAPSGKGWLYDDTALENGSLNTGTYSTSFNLQAGISIFQSNITFRWFKRSSGGVYTQIGTVTMASQYLYGSTNVTYTLPSTTANAMAFTTGDKLYIDGFIQPVTGYSWTVGNFVRVGMGGTSGLTGYTQIVTPGYTTSNVTTKKVPFRLFLRSIGKKSFSNRLLLRTNVNKTLPLRFLERTKKSKSIAWRLIIRLPTFLLLPLRFRMTLSGWKSIGIRLPQGVKKNFSLPMRFLEYGAKLALKNRFLLKVFNKKYIPTRTRLTTKINKPVQFRMRYAYNTGGPFLTGGFGCYGKGVNNSTFDQFRATTYPDRSLSLAPINPTLGSTWFNYTANVPANTSVRMELSYDGITWYDKTSPNGSTFPNLFQQPAPTIDGFAGGDLGTVYTQTASVDGFVGSWNEDVNNSQVLMSGGSKAILYNKNIIRSDVDILADFSNSDGGGIVWRYVNNSNFYYLVLCDDKSNQKAQGVYLYRCSGGVHTLLTSINPSYIVGQSTNDYKIKFARGAYYRFRIIMRGNLISVYMDGNLILSTSDTTITSIGYCGLFNYGGNASCHQLWITPTGDSVTGTPPGDIVTGQFVYTRQTLTTSDPTVSPVIFDVTTMATTPDIQLGATIPSISYNYNFLNNNFDDLTKQSNFMWYYKPDQTFCFGALTLTPSPWILQSNSVGLPSDIDVAASVGSSGGGGASGGGGNGGDLELDIQNDQYRNRQTILGAKNAVQQPVFQFFGDGKTTTFTLGYPVAQTPSIYVNSVQQSVGAKGSSGFQWYCAVGDPIIVQDASQEILQTTDEGACVYIGLEDIIVTVDNPTEQAKRKDIEGGSGIVESVEDHTGENMLQAQATNLATQLINRYANAGRTLIFDTSRDGLAVGQTLPIYFPEYGIIDGNFIIIDIETTLKKDTGDTNVFWYKITCSELAKTNSWSRLLAIGLGLS